MPARLIRDTAILAKIESAYKTDPTPTGASNAILVSNATINSLNAQNVPRDLVRPWLGGSEQLVGTAFKELGYDVELAGSGAAGTAPAYGPLLRACGMAETITAANRVDYLPVSSGLESVTQYAYDSGVLHKYHGSRGTVQWLLGLGERPLMRYRFLGVDGGDSAATPSGTAYTSWQRPQVINDTNTADVTLGCTYSAGSLAGGTVYASRGLEVDLGNMVVHTPLLGAEEIDITQREVTGRVQFDLTAAQEVSFMATVKANTTQSLGLVHGTTAGNIVGIFMPAVQLLNPTKQEINGRRLIGFDFRAVPGSSGNDELRFWCK